MIAFDLKGSQLQSVKSAVLRLTTTNKQFGRTRLGVFLLDAPVVGQRMKPTLGLAAKYPRDYGLGNDPNVCTADLAPERVSEWKSGSSSGKLPVCPV